MDWENPQQHIRPQQNDTKIHCKIFILPKRHTYIYVMLMCVLYETFTFKIFLFFKQKTQKSASKISKFKERDLKFQFLIWIN